MDIKLIDTIYKLNIDTVTQNIDDNYKEQIKEGYRGYLEDMYKDYDFEDETFEEACNRNMDIENFRWNNMSNEEKLSELIEDKSFEEAIDNCTDALVKQLQKMKEKRQDR